MEELAKKKIVDDYRQDYEPLDGSHDCVLQLLDELRTSRECQDVTCPKLFRSNFFEDSGGTQASDGKDSDSETMILVLSLTNSVLQICNVVIEVQPLWNITNAEFFNARLLKHKIQEDLQLGTKEGPLMPNTKNSNGKHEIKNASQRGAKINHDSLCSFAIEDVACRSGGIVYSWMVNAGYAAVWVFCCETNSVNSLMSCKMTLPKVQLSNVDHKLQVL